MDLIQIQEKIELKEKEHSKYQAKEELLLSKLKEMGFDSIEDAEEYVKDKKVEISEKRDKLNTSMQRFESKYETLLK